MGRREEKTAGGQQAKNVKIGRRHQHRNGGREQNASTPTPWAEGRGGGVGVVVGVCGRAHRPSQVAHAGGGQVTTLQVAMIKKCVNFLKSAESVPSKFQFAPNFLA